FRASGALDTIVDFLRLLASLFAQLLFKTGILSEQITKFDFIDALPTAFMKPLSGSGARAVMIETIQNHGVNSLVAKMVAVIQGSTETTFYILAVYFGSVRITMTRYAVGVGLIADFAGILAAIISSYIFFT